MKKIIIAKRCGRLANRLVLFANVIAFAEEYSFRVINFTFQGFAHFFTGTFDTIKCAFPREGKETCGTLVKLIRSTINGVRLQHQSIYFFSKILIKCELLRRFYPIISDQHFNSPKSLSEFSTLVNCEYEKTTFLSGWRFREPKLLSKHADKIRSFFTPIPEYNEQVSRLVNQAKTSCDVLVGLHIRRGDYQLWKGGQYFYSLEDYRVIAQRVKALYPKLEVGFLVCANQKVEYDELSDLNVLISDSIPVVDLYALARCDILVGPPSTFTQWASFYGNTPLNHIYGVNDEVSLEDFSVSDLHEIPGS